MSRHRQQRGLVWPAGFAVALGAGAATAHGLYEVAAAAGVPAPVAWLYPLITDGLALVAYTAAARLTGRQHRQAWTVVVLAAALSGLAQATYLAGAVAAAPTALRFGVGAWPAVAAAIVAHLLHLLARTDTPVAATSVASKAAAGRTDAEPRERTDLNAAAATAGRPRTNATCDSPVPAHPLGPAVPPSAGGPASAAPHSASAKPGARSYLTAAAASRPAADAHALHHAPVAVRPLDPAAAAGACTGGAASAAAVRGGAEPGARTGLPGATAAGLPGARALGGLTAATAGAVAGPATPPVAPQAPAGERATARPPNRASRSDAELLAVLAGRSGPISIRAAARELGCGFSRARRLLTEAGLRPPSTDPNQPPPSTTDGPHETSAEQ